MSKYKYLSALFFILISSLYSNNAFNMGSSYSNGMYLKGIDAINYNPALLGFSGTPSFSISVVPVINASIYTYSDLSLEMYNNYFSKGSEFSPVARQNFLNDIDGAELDINLDVKSQILAATYNNFSFQVNGYYYADLALDKSVLKVIEGLEDDKIYSANKSAGGFMAYSSIEFGYAHDIFQYFKKSEFYQKNDFLKSLNISEITAGINTKLLLAPAMGADTVFMKLKKVEAEFVNNSLGNSSENSQNSLKADIEMIIGGEGSGFGLDFGLAMRFQENMQLGFSVENLLSNMNYTNNKLHRWQLAVDSVDIEELNSLDEYEPAVEKEELSDYKDFDESLPTIFNLGYSWQMNLTGNNLLFSANLSSTINCLTENDEATTFASGLDWYHDNVDWLRLRSGVKLGGPGVVDFGFGFGLVSNHYSCDFAIASRGGIGESVNGLGFGLGMKLFW